MNLWMVFALMTAAAVFAVLWPLARRKELRSGSDIAVYRDQLEEIERDRAAGLIADQEAEAARVEVSRRLIAAADKAESAPAADFSKRWLRRAVALVALVLLPAGAGGLYLMLGSPGMPGEPLAARTNTPPGHDSISALIARVETHLEKNPDDGRGWEIIAPVYMRLGRYEAAVKARSHAIRLLGANAEREADFGEALVSAADGKISAEARSAFERAVKLDAKEVKARFYLGLAAEQDGKREEAASIWRQLLADARPGAPWIALVQEALTRVDPNAPKLPGPKAEDIAAAPATATVQPNELIRGMVERLAERLKTDGSDAEGWFRLVRSYMVLGERDKARAAVIEARRALAADAQKLRFFEEQLKGLGLEG